VVTRLLPQDQFPIEFYAIQVVPGEKVKTNVDYLAFQVQMETIVKLVGEGSKQRARAAYAPVAEADKVRQQILDRYRELVREAREDTRRLDRLRRGQWGNTQIGPEWERMLAEYGADIEALRNTPGAQVFEIGYAWVKNPPPRRNDDPDPFQFQLLLNGEELQTVYNVLDAFRPEAVFAPLLGGGGKPETLREAIIRIVKAMTGELPDPSRSLEDILLKEKALKFRSPFLRCALEHLEDTAFNMNEIFVLEKKKLLLQDLFRGERSSYRKMQPELGGFEVHRWIRQGTPVPHQRGFFIGSVDRPNELTRWYWVHADEEWP